MMTPPEPAMDPQAAIDHPRLFWGEDGVLEWLLRDFGDGPAAEEEAGGDGGQDDPVQFERL